MWHSFVIVIGVDSLKVIIKEGRVFFLSFEEKELQDFIMWQVRTFDKAVIFSLYLLNGILFVYLTFPTFLLLHVTVVAWQSDLCFRCHNTRSRSPRTWPDSWAGRSWAPAPRWACQTWNPQGLPPPLSWQPQTKRGNSNLFTYHYCNTSFILFGVSVFFLLYTWIIPPPPFYFCPFPLLCQWANLKLLIFQLLKLKKECLGDFSLLV